MKGTSFEVSDRLIVSLCLCVIALIAINPYDSEIFVVAAILYESTDCAKDKTTVFKRNIL